VFPALYLCCYRYSIELDIDFHSPLAFVCMSMSFRSHYVLSAVFATMKERKLAPAAPALIYLYGSIL